MDFEKRNYDFDIKKIAIFLETIAQRDIHDTSSSIKKMFYPKKNLEIFTYFHQVNIMQNFVQKTSNKS